MFDLPKGQGQSPAPSWQVVAHGGSIVEVEQITMDIIKKLPKSARGYDAI